MPVGQLAHVPVRRAAETGNAPGRGVPGGGPAGGLVVAGRVEGSPPIGRHICPPTGVGTARLSAGRPGRSPVPGGPGAGPGARPDAVETAQARSGRPRDDRYRSSPAGSTAPGTPPTTAGIPG